MSRLENDHAKPVLKDMILYGRDVTLLPAALTSLSLFAFKLLVVANHNGEQQRFFTAKDRHLFAKHLAIPQGVQVWIASRKSHARYHHTGVFNSHFGKLPARTNNAIELYVCTWGIGHLLIQTVGVRWALRATRRRNVPLPTLRQNDAMNDSAIAVWPNQQKPIVWPPKLHIGDDTIDLFCDRWENLNFPSSLLNAPTM
jgi:hypothetical protein